MEKTYVIKGKPESKWVLFDASNQSLGRLATQIAFYLLGKHKPEFTPGVDMGDFVVVINVSQLGLTQRLLNDKNYYRHSGYPGGIKKTSLPEMMINHPDRVMRAAVWGMLPHNKIGRKLIKRLKLYPGSEHPHAAQNPNPVA